MANDNCPPIRFTSVDALRGITVAAMLLVNNPGDWGHVYWPLLHAQWHGITPTDLVFPFFLFIVGVSIALGIVPRVEAGADPAVLRRSICMRAAKIIGLGLVLHLLAFWLMDKAWFRPWGVLQRIGFCFAVAGLFALYVRPRAQWIFIAVVLLGFSNGNRVLLGLGLAGLIVFLLAAPSPRSGSRTRGTPRDRTG